MTTYIVQKQSPQAQQYNIQLDGDTYTASIYWMAFSQRFYISIYDGAGDLVLNKADRKSTRLNSSHSQQSRMPSSA